MVCVINMERPKISVIFPVYNVEKYVEEALDSIVNQTIFEDIEVVIVDDGSTDNSRFIITKYELDHDNIKIVRKENGGLSSARNCGIDNASGEYIHFFDSDDILLPYAYEKLYDLTIKNDLEVTTSNFLRFNDEKTWNHHTPQFVFKEIDEDCELTNMMEYTNLSWDMYCTNKLYKTDFLKCNNIRFFEGITFEDNLFTIEVYSKAKKVGLLDDYTFCWRTRESNDSITQSFTLKRATDLVNMFHMVQDFLEENIHDKEVLRTKYLKWLTVDISYFIETIQNYPEEEHRHLFESIYGVYNLIPDEFTENLNSYYSTLYKMLKNKDWDSLLLYTSNNYKNTPILPEGLKEEYKKDIDFKKDAMGEDLDIYTNNISKEGNEIIIKYNYKIPFLEKTDDFDMNVRISNTESEDVVLDSKYIDKYQFRIPVDLLKPGKSTVMMNFKSGEIEKEYYLKNVSRKTFSFDNFDVDVLRGRASDIRILKHYKNNSEHHINEVIFNDKESFELKGLSNSTDNHIAINDYLDFSKLTYPIDYNKIGDGKYEFSIKIPYNDFLKAPVKKWDFFIEGDFNKINLERNHEFINEHYRIYLKNFGNRITLELIRYYPIEAIEILKNENNALKKKNIKLEKTINQYKNRKDVKTVDKMKRLLKK